MTLEEHLARDLAKAWFDTCEQPIHWAALPSLKREVFMILARTAIKSGREYREARAPKPAPMTPPCTNTANV
jgi:hypothetical protein